VGRSSALLAVRPGAEIRPHSILRSHPMWWLWITNHSLTLCGASPRLPLVTCSVKDLVLSMSVLRRNTSVWSGDGLLVGLMCPRAPGERTALLRRRG
jgi:hypothetical protein